MIFEMSSQIISGSFDSSVIIGDFDSTLTGDLIIWKDHNGGSFGLEPSVIYVGNNAGKFQIVTAQADGAFSPISQSGDMIIKKLGADTDIIFNMATATAP